MIIILEGPDLAGKSTLAQQYAETVKRFDITPHHIHRGPLKPDRDPFEEYTLTDHEKFLAKDPDHCLIVDRWYPSEMVYGPIFRKGTRVSLRDAIELASRIPMEDARFRLLLPPVNLLIHRYEERGDDFIKKRHIYEIHRSYAALYQTHLHQFNWALVHNKHWDEYK